MNLKIQNMKGSAEKTKIVETTRIKMCCETLRQSLIQVNNKKKRWEKPDNIKNKKKNGNKLEQPEELTYKKTDLIKNFSSVS